MNEWEESTISCDMCMHPTGLEDRESRVTKKLHKNGWFMCPICDRPGEPDAVPV